MLEPRRIPKMVEGKTPKEGDNCAEEDCEYSDIISWALSAPLQPPAIYNTPNHMLSLD